MSAAEAMGEAFRRGSLPTPALDEVPADDCTPIEVLLTRPGLGPVRRATVERDIDGWIVSVGADEPVRAATEDDAWARVRRAPVMPMAETPNSAEIAIEALRRIYAETFDRRARDLAAAAVARIERGGSS